MSLIQTGWPAAEGRMTPQGVRCGDRYYSCAHAIKAGWFERSRTAGEWNVRVYFDPSENSTGGGRPAGAAQPPELLYIETAEALVACRLLDNHPPKGQAVERYFEMFQEMMRERNSNRKKLKARRGR